MYTIYNERTAFYISGWVLSLPATKKRKVIDYLVDNRRLRAYQL
jgi:hypothetical protein